MADINEVVTVESVRPRLNVRLIVGLVFLLSVVGFVISAPLIGSPTSTNLGARLLPPLTDGHFLGTDQLGRDIGARLAWGGCSSLLVGALVVLVSGAVGTTLGIAAGYFGGRVDAFISRLIDAQLALPLLVFLLMILAVVGPSRPTIVLVLSLAQWPEVARLARALTLVERHQVAVEAAVVAGVRRLTILRRHILPHVRGALGVLLLVSMAQAILLESALSYLGVGVQRPTPTWGRILSDGQALIGSAWWLVVLPGLLIVLLVLGANLIADSLRTDD